MPSGYIAGELLKVQTTGGYTLVSSGVPAAQVPVKTSPLNQFATTTSSQLLSVIPDATGDGKLVFSNNPVFVTPDLGTPTAVNLVNSTGTAVNLIAGKATTLATPRAINGVAFDGSAAITIWQSMSGAVTAVQGSSIVSQIVDACVFFDPPYDGTFVMNAKASFAVTINAIRGLKTATGTCTLSIRINGTAVTGLGAIAVTTTAQDIAATALNAMAVDSRLTFVLTSTTNATGLEFTLKGTR